MSRNKEKIPFSKILNNKKKWIQIYNKNFIIMPQDINCIYNIYNGKIFIKIKIIKEMIGYKFGEFINTRKRYIYTKTKKKR